MPRVLLAGALALAALVGLAFWPGYLSKAPAAVDRYTHFHAFIATTWLLLLIAQPMLIATSRYEWHRLLGRASWLLGPLFVLSSVLLAHFRFSRMDDPTFVTEARFLYLPLSAAFLFAVSFALAMVHLRVVELHSRFLACTALLLVDPVCGRVLAFHVVELPQAWHYQLVTFGIEIAAVVALTGSLAPGTVPRRIFALFAVFYTATLLMFFAGARSAYWLGIADWFRRLPLT